MAVGLIKNKITDTGMDVVINNQNANVQLLDNMPLPVTVEKGRTGGGDGWVEGYVVKFNNGFAFLDVLANIPALDLSSGQADAEVNLTDFFDVLTTVYTITANPDAATNPGAYGACTCGQQEPNKIRLRFTTNRPGMVYINCHLHITGTWE